LKLVETEVERPEDEVEPPPVVTPPRPEKRGAYVPLTLTLAVLVGIVVTIYTVFPERKTEATKLAIAHHRKAEQTWQLRDPSRKELEAWTLALLNGAAPLPADGPDVVAVGARPVEVRHRNAAYIRFRVDGADVSYLVGHTRDAPDVRVSRRDGDEQVESWHSGEWTIIAVGPADGADAWRARVGVP
jgi:hypothetical protein